MIKLIPFLTLLLILGCEDKEDKILEGDALLRWTGDYAVDGCGFFLDIGEQEFKPEDETAIADSFKIDSGVEVFIKYELADDIDIFCGWNTQTFTSIKLHSIENR